MTGRLLAGSLLIVLLASSVLAQGPMPLELRAWEFHHLLTQAQGKAEGGPKLPDAAAFDKLVVDSLRDVHNRGADLYNTSKEFDATYRMYQGGLLAVRPLLAHRPAAQKLIDEGLAAAEKETNLAQRAFKLHETIEAVRAYLKDANTPAKPVEPVKKPDDKPKPVDPPKKPDDKVKPKESFEIAPPPKEKPPAKPTKPASPQ